MAFFNYVTKEITLKIVYYGPGLSGKTTNLQHLYSLLDPSSRGRFISLSTESDRTLFFDFLPVDLGKIKDFSVRFQLYTVPGQIRYNATRKLVLKGADAIVFVADSQRDMREQNRESFVNMRENLLSNNLDPDEIPVVFQYNKRDLPNILSREDLHGDLNIKNREEIEAIAVKGEGVLETFRMISKTLLKDIYRKHKMDIAAGPAPEAKTRQIPVSTPVEEASPREDLMREAGQETIVNAVIHEEAPQRERTFVPPPKSAPRPETAPSPKPETAFIIDEKFSFAVKEGLAEINRSLADIKETLKFISAEMKESARHQADILWIIRDLNDLMNRRKRKKRWFF